MWATIVFRLGCANVTQIDYGLRIRIKNMWLTGVYFVLLRFIRAKFWHRNDRLCFSKETRASSRSCAAILSRRAPRDERCIAHHHSSPHTLCPKTEAITDAGPPGPRAMSSLRAQFSS